VQQQQLLQQLSSQQQLSTSASQNNSNRTTVISSNKVLANNQQQQPQQLQVQQQLVPTSPTTVASLATSSAQTISVLTAGGNGTAGAQGGTTTLVSFDASAMGAAGGVQGQIDPSLTLADHENHLNQLVFNSQWNQKVWQKIAQRLIVDPPRSPSETPPLPTSGGGPLSPNSKNAGNCKRWIDLNQKKSY
jgi:hypothetical protein